MRDVYAETHNRNAGSHLYGRLPAEWERIEVSVRAGRKINIYRDPVTDEVVLIRAVTGRDSWNTADAWLKDGAIDYRRMSGPAKVVAAIRAMAERINRDGLKAALRSYGEEHGICCCCGAYLTDPVSRAKGIGPVCDRKVGAAVLMRYLLGA